MFKNLLKIKNWNLKIAVFALSVFFCANTADAAVLKPMNNLGLIGYWPLDEGSGTIAGDVSGKNNKGVLTNGPTWASGKFGKALNFDNANDYVDAGDINAMDGLTQITASVWVKSNNTSAATNETHFIDKSTCSGNANGGVFEILSWPTSHKANFTVYPSGGNGVFSGESSANIDDMKWHHLVGTYNGSVLALYMDGALVNSASVGSFTMQSSAHRFEIGSTCNGSNNGYIWDGQIDDARVYNRAISLSEIKQLYSSGSAKLGSSADLTNGALKNGLVGHWTFDGKDMTPNVRDSSGQGNHGNLSGFTSTTTTIGKIGQGLNFDGSNDYINRNALSSLNSGDMTMCVWLNPNTVSGQKWILQQWNDSPGYGPALFTSGADMIFEIGQYVDNVVTSGSLLKKDTWQHVCAKASGTTLSIFYNGVSSVSGVRTRTESISPNFGIGGPNNLGSVASFSGKMDEVRVYNRALSASEINQIYNLGGAKLASSADFNSGSTLKSGLVGHWTFDGKDMVPNVRDASGYGYNGNLIYFTSTTTTIGKIGQALSFDGTNDFVHVPVAPTLVSPNTTSFWFYPTTFNNTPQGFIAHGLGDSGSQIFLRATGDIEIDSYSAGTFRAWCNKDYTASDLNQWHHLVVIINSTTNASLWKCYLDGVDVGVSGDSSGTYGNPGNTDWTIGAYYNNSDWFNGKMDDVRVYNRALSASEAKQLYNLGR